MAHTIKSAANVQEWVLQRLDEVTPEGSEQSVPAEVIANELGESVRDTVLAAPAVLLAPAMKSGTAAANGRATLAVHEDEAGRVMSTSLVIPLPHGALRPLRIKLVGWRVPLQEALIAKEDTGDYDGLVAGELRPDARHPAAVLRPYFDPVATDPAEASSLALECWPVSDAAKALVGQVGSGPVAELLYVPTLRVDAIPADLQDAMVWLAVARIADSFLKDYEAGAAARTHADLSMQSRLARFSHLSEHTHDQKVFKYRYRPFV